MFVSLSVGNVLVSHLKTIVFLRFLFNAVPTDALSSNAFKSVPSSTLQFGFQSPFCKITLKEIAKPTKPAVFKEVPLKG